MHKNSISLLKVFFILSLWLRSTQGFSQDQKPNIIVFLVDDMGWMDTSVPFSDSAMAFNRMFHTPNMEQLAREGVKFTNAYATPVCTPSRVSLMTGVNAAHHQVTNWTHLLKDTPSDQEDSLFNRIDWNFNGFSPVTNSPHTFYATPLPQLLKEAGYFTVHVGKAHWGSQGTPGANPLNLGFMVNVAGNAIGHPQSYLGKDNYGNMPGKFTYNAVQDLAEYYGTDTYLTEALTREALKSIEAPAKMKQPFFLHLAHYAVHVPIQEDNRFIQKYLDKGLAVEQARYASLVEGMDKSLGDVMDFLAKNNLSNNTILIFMSDNGGLSLENARSGPAHSQNLPLKAGKGSVHEGGIREPMIVKWPQFTQPNSSTDQAIIIEDFFPSILEMAGIQDPTLVQHVDGQSFVPVLKGAPVPNEDRLLIWHYPHRWVNQEGPGINYFSALRQGKWKLIYDYRQGKLSLYDLNQDLGEHNDLSLTEKRITRKLAKALSSQLRAWNAIMPTYKLTGKLVPWPDEIR